MAKKLLLTSASIIILSVAAYANLDTGELRDYISSAPSAKHLSPTLKEFQDNSKLDVSLQPLPLVQDQKAQPPASKLYDSVLTESTILMEMPDPEAMKSVTVESKPIAGFTINAAIDYGRLAQLAYIDVGNPEDEKFETIERLQREGNRVQFFGTEAENSGLIITHNDGRISVVYKGTNSLRNLATDAWFNFAIDDETGLRCHNGFMKGFYRTKDQVFAVLEQIAKARGKTILELLNDDVTVTGHSLGGGLAQMFMGYATRIYGAVPAAVTFATPRVFDISTAEEMDTKFGDKYLNAMQVTDPIPGIALGAVGYKHFGKKLHLPYAKSDLQHKMSGYLKALEGLRNSGKITVGSTTFTYEESNRTGLGKAPRIGNTSIPNPLYPLHTIRESIARHVDPVVHKAVKTVKDTAINAISSVGNAARSAWNYLWS